MSASNERKRRQAAREQEIENQAEIRRDASRSRRRRGFGKLIWGVVITAIVLVVVAGSVLSSDLMYRLPAATVGNTTYSGAELRYYYMDVYRTLASYEIIDVTKPVAEQDCDQLEEEGATWHDYIMQYMETSLIQTEALLEGAKADGYTLSEDGKSSVESVMDDFRAAAEQNEVSLKQFMRLYYGDGVTPKLVEKLLTRTALASEYEQHVKDSFTYTEEELAAYYNEHIDEYKTYSFMYYFIADSAVPEPKEEEPAEGEGDDETAPDTDDAQAEDTDESAEASPYYLDENGEPVLGPDGEPIEIQYVLDENGEQLLDKNGAPYQMLLVYDDDGNVALDEEGKPTLRRPVSSLTPAQSFANIISAYATDEESFIAAVDALKPGDKPGLTEGVLKANLPIEWLGEEEREYGEMTIATGENDEGESGCYVLMYVGCDEQHYPEVSARHILVATVDEDEDGTYSEEERAAAREKMDEIQKEWESGEQTELRFAALAIQYSEDTGSNENGGLYEGIYKGQMVEEFNDFCFAEGRKSGDTAVVHGTAANYDGYHLIYYVGEGGRHSDALARDALYTADVSAWSASLVEGYEVSYKWGSRYMNTGV